MLDSLYLIEFQGIVDCICIIVPTSLLLGGLDFVKDRVVR